MKEIDKEIVNYITYWTTKSKKVVDKLVDTFDDESVAKKLKKLLKK